MIISRPIKAPTLGPCLPGFENVNRYLDRQRGCYVAKILPGEFYVTRQPELIATTLGSCVSACIWDEFSGIGGMNHFMLPLTEKDADKITWGNMLSDATRYGNYAMEHMINELLKHGALRSRLKAKVFGGAKVLERMSDVGAKNAEFVIQYLAMENLPILSESLQGIYPRKVLFAPLTGKAMMKALKTMHNDTIITRERRYQEDIVKAPVDGDVELF